MPESPATNPYKPADDSLSYVERPRGSGQPSHNVILLCLGFGVLRGIAAGFATLIMLVYMSGTSIHWENATPLLLLGMGVCVALHVIEWIFRFPPQVTWKLGALGYVLGSVVVTMAGMIGLFPNPFH